MIGVLIVSHGNLARSLVESTEIIMDKESGFNVLCLDWNSSVDKMKKQVKRSIKNSMKEDGLIILTDIFGGTPTNLVLPFFEKDRIEIISGVNLPMLMKLVKFKDMGSPEKVIKMLYRKGVESIKDVSNYFKE